MKSSHTTKLWQLIKNVVTCWNRIWKRTEFCNVRQKNIKSHVCPTTLHGVIKHYNHLLTNNIDTRKTHEFQYKELQRNVILLSTHPSTMNAILTDRLIQAPPDSCSPVYLNFAHGQMTAVKPTRASVISRDRARHPGDTHSRGFKGQKHNNRCVARVRKARRYLRSISCHPSRPHIFSCGLTLSRSSRI